MKELKCFNRFRTIVTRNFCSILKGASRVTKTMLLKGIWIVEAKVLCVVVERKEKLRKKSLRALKTKRTCMLMAIRDRGLEIEQIQGF